MKLEFGRKNNKYVIKINRKNIHLLANKYT